MLFKFKKSKTEKMNIGVPPRPDTDADKKPLPPNPMEEAKRPETIRALLLPVGEPPVCVTIQNSYETNQKLVNGPVSSAFVDLATRDALIIMNDMAKLWKLPPNRYIFDGKDVLCGQAVIVAFDNDKHRVCDMSDELVAKYKAMFAKPITGQEAKVLDPIIEKHAKVTVSDLSGENEQKFSLDEVREGMGLDKNGNEIPKEQGSDNTTK